MKFLYWKLLRVIIFRGKNHNGLPFVDPRLTFIMILIIISILLTIIATFPTTKFWLPACLWYGNCLKLSSDSKFFTEIWQFLKTEELDKGFQTISEDF